ncbi:MAG: carboxypeptidase-like regulatory domain-containing protein, partial [Actinobacteria bacterium]|nr:carboxypeptidase-like regulatory domain-containing protein [Actinomycetota bacterium]
DSSDAEGRYQLYPPTGGSYLVICASVEQPPTAALVAVGEGPARHDVILIGGGASLSGTVYSAESREPIAGGMVTLVDIRGDVAAAVSTQPDGRFSFPELAQGRYTLTVTVATLRPVAHTVEVPAAGLVHHDVEVPARVQLVGVVRTATAGAPVPEALATLMAPDGHVVGSAITDTDGGFVFDDLTAGVYTVITTGYPPVAAEVHLGAGAPTEMVITLRPPTPPDAVAGNGAISGHAEREGDGHGTR